MVEAVEFNPPSFGLARVQAEGSPVHPDDFDWVSQEWYDRQLKAYNDFWEKNNNNNSM